MNFILQFLRTNKKEIRFFTLFIVFFLAGYFLVNYNNSYLKMQYNEILNVRVCNALINHVLRPLEFRLFGTQAPSGTSVIIGEGCEGLEGLILILSAICAFPLVVSRKIIGIVLGSLIIYIANISRIILLDYMVKYKPSWFDFFHVIVGQTFIIVIGVSFFILWMQQSTPHSPKENNAEQLV